MNIRNQLCTIEQAKKLKELGVIQESEFAYFMDKNHLVRRNRNYELSEVDYCAFTVAELGVMLCKYANDCWWYKGAEWVQLTQNETVFQTQAECYADFLIHLLETKAITAEEVNQRLINS